jgi:hypothetical protein
METVSHVRWKIHGSLIPIDFDGLFGGVEHDSTTVAVLQVSFQLLAEVFFQFAVNIKVQLLQDFLTVHNRFPWERRLSGFLIALPFFLM